MTAPSSQPVHQSPLDVCGRTRSSSAENWTDRHDDGEVRWRAHWSGDDCTVDLRATGDPKFNGDFTDVTSVSNGGTLDITAIIGRQVRKIAFRSDGSRQLSIDGHAAPWDDAARRWLADLLIDLDRMSGIGVDYRLPTLLSHGGVPAVLDETEKMSSDYVRSLYLLRLIGRHQLSENEYQRIVVSVARDIHSDYEKSRILRAVADHSSLDNEGTRRAYLDAVDRMTSDYERSRILQTVFSKTRLSHDLARSAVRSAGTFRSDYERSQVLLAAISNQSLDGNDAQPVIEAIAKSNSDYERSRVMRAVAERWKLDADARRAYLRAAATIKSDYENRRVLAALVRTEERND
ncbi:MAG TPA: hypothetical protein VGM82_16595 [Gemmatimonadaceae bacterium]